MSESVVEAASYEYDEKGRLILTIAIAKEAIDKVDLSDVFRRVGEGLSGIVRISVEVAEDLEPVSDTTIEDTDAMLPNEGALRVGDKTVVSTVKSETPHDAVPSETVNVDPGENAQGQIGDEEYFKQEASSEAEEMISSILVKWLNNVFGDENRDKIRQLTRDQSKVLVELLIDFRAGRAKMSQEGRQEALDILLYTADGLTPRQIAEKLGVSDQRVSTKKYHLWQDLRPLIGDNWYEFIQRVRSAENSDNLTLYQESVVESTQSGQAFLAASQS